MYNTKIINDEIFINRPGELIVVSAVGASAIRFRSFPGGRVIDENYNLMPQPTDCDIEEREYETIMTVGTLSVNVNHRGRVTFYVNGETVLLEQPELTFNDGFRRHRSIGNELWRSHVTFEPNEDERFYGMGHSWDNGFDLKGNTVDIINLNAKCTIPFVYSSMGYGFCWNVPSTGTAEFGNNRTRWKTDACKFIDYVVIGGDLKHTSEILADIYGHAPKMPEWAAGFWQSRLRYETQEELLEVARRYKKENIPLSVIIADYFHWTEQGEYKFAPEYWPDVKAMTDELHEMGIKLMVSIWPTINENSENYWHMLSNNMLIRTTGGSNRVFDFYGPQAEIDVMNPATREFVFSKIKENYLDNGVDALWFDEAEPEIHPEHFDNLVFYKGRGDAVGLLYPYYYSQMAYEGLKSTGRDDIVTLTRCAYFGSQKFGSLVWSGDIPSTFESLAHQVNAGINMSVCGIPWWNTDIGGFYGGDTTNESYRELILRWFQFGVFSPVMRVHGHRDKHGERSGLKEASGDPNELWSFGDENFPVLRELVMLRERLKPYILEHMDIASEKGHPVMRPMFFDFPDDANCYDLNEQYMFGSDIIFAPIVHEKQTEKEFYVPDGEWVLTKDGTVYTKGFHTATAEKNEFIALVRKGAAVLGVFDYA